MITVGIDVGSTATKAVAFDGTIRAWAIRPTGWSPKDAGASILSEVLDQAGIVQDDVTRIIGTGYGRISLPFIDRAVTEITCHAQGAHWCFPDISMIIDVGGQDSKVIKINQTGKVIQFQMNDKCAAGTGRFLQVMAQALGMELTEMSALSLADPVTINSMCTVFAESEVISLLAAGETKERIAAGLLLAVARRVATLAGARTVPEKVAFTGGVAKNQSLCQALEGELQTKICTPAEPQIIGALGAAIIGQK